MVERKKSEGFEEFEGVIKNVTLDKSELKGQTREQYHLEIEPINVEIKGKTGLMHEWIPISDKTEDELIVEGSVLDKYVQQLEILHSEVKKLQAHAEVLNFIKGKKYLFKRVKHGKSFEKFEAKEYWTPVKEL